MASKADRGSRAERARGSRASSWSVAPVMAAWGAAARTAVRGADSSVAQPVRTRYSASTVRAKPPRRAAQDCSWARVSSTSRVWGYGARGSA